MIRLNINSKLHGIRTRDFNTQLELDAQVALWNSTKHFGEPEDYWVIAQKDLQGVVAIPSEALQTRIVNVPATELNVAYSYTECLMPKAVTYSTQDITSILAQQKINETSVQFLNNSDWKVLRHLREKTLGLPTSLTEEAYLALERERNAAAIKVVR